MPTEHSEPAGAGQEDIDFITILTSAGGNILTKRHTPTGTIEAPNETLFTSKAVPVRSIEELAAALDCPPSSCVIIGKLRDGVNPYRPHRRLLYAAHDGTPPTYDETAHTFAIVDLDGRCDLLHPVDAEGNWPWFIGRGWLDDIKSTIRHAVAEWRRPELHDVDVAWRLTGSAGIKQGVRLRLAFMLDRRVSLDEQKIWFSAADPCTGKRYADPAVFRVVQPIYGDPVFDGVPDPIATRWDCHSAPASSGAIAPSNATGHHGAAAAGCRRRSVAEGGTD